MLKKTVSIALALMLLISFSALAAGKINVSQENFYAYDSYGSTYCYTYARVDNIGDKPMAVNAGIVEVFDVNGDTVTSSDYISMYAPVLQPGEYTYVSNYDYLDTVTPDDIDDYQLTVTGKSDSNYVVTRFPVTTDYAEKVSEGYSTYNYMYATVTNDTDEVIYDLNVVLVLLDDDGNILYMSNQTMYNVGLEPGSSATIRGSVYDDYLAMLEKKGLAPTHVDAIAYTQVWN